MKKIILGILLLCAPFSAFAVGYVDTGTGNVYHDETVVTAFLYDGTYYDASTDNPWTMGGWTGTFTTEGDSVKFIDDVNGCYLTSTPYDTCISSGGLAIDSTCGYYYTGGVWIEDTSCGTPTPSPTGTSTVEELLTEIHHDTLWFLWLLAFACSFLWFERYYKT